VEKNQFQNQFFAAPLRRCETKPTKILILCDLATLGEKFKLKKNLKSDSYGIKNP
jgi:hypothetical protein